MRRVARARMSNRLPPSHLPEHLLEKFPVLFHMLFDVREQVFRPGLPIFGLIADAAGEKK